METCVHAGKPGPGTLHFWNLALLRILVPNRYLKTNRYSNELGVSTIQTLYNGDTIRQTKRALAGADWHPASFHS
jgi:hypothetical protein